MSVHRPQRDPLDAVQSARLAAATLLAEPGVDRTLVASALYAGWLRLFEAGRGSDDDSLVDWVGSARLGGLSESERAEVAAALPGLQEAARAALEGREVVEPGRAVLRRQLRLFRRAASHALDARRGGLSRWLRRAAPYAGLALVAAGMVFGALFLAERADQGWRGAYYPREEFAGEPIVQRDFEIGFRWGKEAPLPDFPKDRFTVRWDTCLEVAEPEEVALRLGSDDGSRLFINGETVIDNWRVQSFHWASQTVTLPKGRHHLRVDFFEQTAGAGIAFEAQTPGLPPSNLDLARFRVPVGELDDPDVCD